MFVNFTFQCLLLLLLVLRYRTETEINRRVITTLKYSKRYVKPTIVNGYPVSPAQAPYMVSIKESLNYQTGDGKVWTNLCGGSIISELKVLTAAHCFEDSNFYYAKRPDQLRLVAGDKHTNLRHSGNTTNDRTGSQWRRIRTVRLHHEFNFPNYDIALVTVDMPWTYMEHVNYAVIARRNIDYPPTCMAVGYGRVGYGLLDRDSTMMLRAQLNILTRRQCSNLWELNMDAFVCTTSRLNDVAQGDSGGPLACRDTLDLAEEPGKDLLVGVVSGKNFDKTSLFTRVSAYKDWIEASGAPTKHDRKNWYISGITLILLFTLQVLI